jgi:hypothetical protein
MRAQASITEAFLAILLLMPAAMAVSYASYAGSMASGRQLARFSDAFYDFADMAYSNVTVGGCLIAGNAACESNISDMLHSYGAIGAKVYVHGNVPLDANASCGESYYKCLPFLDKGNYTIACIYLCGG